jgi:hypothetical protein
VQQHSATQDDTTNVLFSADIQVSVSTSDESGGATDEGV